MPANDDFVQEMTKGLFGEATNKQEKIDETSPAKASFVDLAIGDLKGGTSKVKTGVDAKLENAFNQSIEERVDLDRSAELVEEFKKIAGDEAKSTLGKLLKSIR